MLFNSDGCSNVIKIICYFSSLSHQPSGLRLLQRNAFATFIRSITRRCAHATAPAHGALSAAYDGWWSADKFTAPLPVCSERAQEERRPVYLRVQMLFIIHACGRSLPLVRVPRDSFRTRERERILSPKDNYAISSLALFVSRHPA